jgi:hypothetical protein
MSKSGTRAAVRYGPATPAGTGEVIRRSVSTAHDNRSGESPHGPAAAHPVIRAATRPGRPLLGRAVGRVTVTGASSWVTSPDMIKVIDCLH